MAFEIKQTTSELEKDKLSLASRILGPGRLVRMAERLRENNQQIPELNFCAVSDEGMIGGIAFWPIQIGSTPALLLGPLIVNPEWQGKGVGRGLMATSLAAAWERWTGPTLREQTWAILSGSLRVSAKSAALTWKV